MEQEEKKQFDVDREITLHIPSPAGRKTITVRYPTDDEWKARMRDQQTIQRSFSKGESETEVLNGEAVDAKLLAKIRTDEGGSEVDEYEASAVISNLARAKDVEIERGGNGFRVSFTAFGGARVSHLLRMPSLKQIGQYKKGTCRPLDARNNVTRLRISLQPAEDLYDAIIENVEGYKSKVPVVHKAAVAVQVRADLDAIAEEMDPE